MLFLYSLLYYIAIVFVLPYHYLRRPSELRRRWLRERLGYVPKRTGGNDRPLFWIHAVSVGEAIAARPLIREISKDADIVITTVTDTGQKVVRDFVEDRASVFYAPFDTIGAVKRFIQRQRPKLLLIMETELWPNLVTIARKYSLSVMIVNGRISEHSFRGYRKIRFFMKTILEKIDLFCMQTKTDAERIINIGAPRERTCHVGNMKFEVEPPDEIPQWCQKLSKPVIVAGSTHEGEEEIIINAFRKIKNDYPEATLVLAPRHPERFPLVEALLKREEINYGKRSEDDTSGRDIVILDTIGELASVYGAADICIIGGSFVPKGGHNLFEPAFWQKPIITGPYMDNFPLSEEFFQADAALLSEPQELETRIKELLRDVSRAETVGKKARQLYDANRGALKRTVELLKRLV